MKEFDQSSSTELEITLNRFAQNYSALWDTYCGDLDLRHPTNFSVGLRRLYWASPESRKASQAYSYDLSEDDRQVVDQAIARREKKDAT